MKQEDFPIDEKLLHELAEQCRRQQIHTNGKKALYINLSMVRLQLSWILPKFIYAAGAAGAKDLKVYVLCWKTNELLSELCKSFGYILISLDELNLKHPLCGLKAFFKTLAFMLSDGSGEGMKKLRFCNMPVGMYLYEDILRTSEFSTIRSARNLICIKKFFHLLWMCAALDRQLKAAPPLLLVSDDRAYHEAMQLALFYRAGAKVRNVSSKREEVIPFDEKGEVIRRHKNANMLLKETKDCPDGMEEKVEEILNALFSGNSGKELDRGAFKDKNVYSRAEIVKQLGLDPQKKNVVIMAHTFSDAVYTFGPLYFRDYYDWADKTLSIAEGVANVNWILKPHPSRKAYHESRDSIEKMYERHRKPHIFLMPEEVSTESIKELADVIITIGSNAGAQFSCFGIPVVIVGKPYYSGFGYTIEPADYEEYEKTLRNAAGIQRLSEEQRREARRIYYLRRELFPQVFTDEFAMLLSKPYDEMLSKMAVKYFDSNKGTKSYNNEAAKNAISWLGENDIRTCEYYKKGTEAVRGEG